LHVAFAVEFQDCDGRGVWRATLATGNGEQGIGTDFDTTPQQGADDGVIEFNEAWHRWRSGCGDACILCGGVNRGHESVAPVIAGNRLLPAKKGVFFPASINDKIDRCQRDRRRNGWQV
jgi:hypothetical protein